MADERQQSLMDDQDVTIPDELPQIENLQNALEGKNLKVVTSTDILQQAFHEADGYTQVSTFSNSQNSVFQETIHHLSDHSYIHSSNSNINISSCDANSQDADSSDNCLKDDSECKNLPLSSISLQTTVSESDLNTSQILEASAFSEDVNKMSLNGDVLSFSTISDGTNIDVFTNSLTINNNPVSTNNSQACDSSVIETPVTESFNPVFIIKNMDSTIVTSSLSLPSTSHDLSSIKVPTKQTSAPLGSVENPIQIIQNGNSYHATQVLTQAQLQQISHVLQKQQAKKALESKGKSILYDPSTNTRIVCRIVHPSELQSQSSQESGAESTPKESLARLSNSFRGRGRPRKFQSRKPKEEEKTNPVLSKEEREEKKKHRPRTRSGRISKPPSYMVKDYKRIHHLDFNEEPYDDSDGGYSDYQVSDEEKEKWAPKKKCLPPGVTTAKQRNYSCQSCSKAYIGRGGLSRHYRTHPSHGSMAEGEDVSTQDENSNSSLASSVLSNSGCNTNSQTSSGNISNQISSSSINSQNSNCNISSKSSSNDINCQISNCDISSQISSCNISSQISSGNINSEISSVSIYNQISSSGSNNHPTTFISQAELAKILSAESSSPQAVPEVNSAVASNLRKPRLREVLKNYPDEDIIDAVLPKIAQEVSLWDFFTAKFSNESNGLSIFEMLREFEKFITHLQTESHNCLSPANLQDAQENTIINISSKEIAAALRLETGPYIVKTATSITEPEPEPQPKPANKVFKENNKASDVLGISNEAPLFKRKRLDVSVEDASTGLPEQILSDVISESDNLELHLPEENLSSNVELQTQDVHLLSSSICNVDNHHDIVSKALYDLNSSTIVTPSSLSSGCLSAVNASRTPPTPLLATRSPQKLQNIQVRKLQLLGSQPQQLVPRNDVTVTVPVSNMSVPTDSNLTDLSSTSQIINKEPIVVQKQIEMCNNSITNKTFQGLPLDASVDIFSSSIQGLPAQAVVLDNNAESNHTVSLINTTDIHNQNVPSDTSQTTSVQTELVENIANCLPDPHIASSLQNCNSIVTTGLQALVPSDVNINTAITGETRGFETTHNVISEVSKLPESSAMLSHVMLPDGQVLSIWSPMENSEKIPNEQFLQNYVPGNLIILQNPDGSIQVPNNQSVPTETLQTLTTLNQGISNETGTHAFTSVRPM